MVDLNQKIIDGNTKTPANEFEAILRRLKEAANVHSDVDLAKKLKIYPQNISAARKKKEVPRGGITRRIRPYDLRHHFVTAALEGGADIGALADVVGSSPETLRRHYQHVTSELHRKTVATIPPLNAPEEIETK